MRSTRAPAAAPAPGRRPDEQRRLDSSSRDHVAHDTAGVPRDDRWRSRPRRRDPRDAEPRALGDPRAAARQDGRVSVQRRLRGLGRRDPRIRREGCRTAPRGARRRHLVLGQRLGVQRRTVRGSDGQGHGLRWPPRQGLPDDEGLRPRRGRGPQANRRLAAAPANRSRRPVAVPRDPVRGRRAPHLRPRRGRAEGRARGEEGRQAAVHRFLGAP